MMKKTVLILLLFVPLFVFGQADRKLDADGKLLYQYQRTVSDPCDTCSEITVTFLFVNGGHPTAISLRQEAFDTDVRWIDIPGGTAGHEEVVELCTANLEPNQSVTWTYAVSAKKGKISAPEKAALLIMDEKYAVDKIWLK